MSGIFLILIAIFLFLLLIVFHEFGHFVCAKLSGVKVNEFAIGMGPTVFSIQKRETLYSLRAIPIGGFCAMEGEDEESKEIRSFSNASVYKRMLIVVAGGVMNIILAFIFMMVILLQQESFASTKISKFSENSTTSQYGLQVGDTIKKIDGYGINTYTDVVFALAMKKDFTADFVVERNGSLVEISNVHLNTGKDKDGNTVISRDFYVQPIKKNLGSFLRQTFLEIFSNTKLTYVSLWKTITGEYGLNAVSGPVGMAVVIKDAATSGLQENFLKAVNNILMIMMVISVSLGVMNLLPFPALDGGRLVFLLIEAIIRKPVALKYEAIVHKVGFIILLMFILFITFNDILKLITGKGLTG
ncbi:MAG: site-2 protease family protein [Clostridia bacterium]|nr:site-2 protease family protein [Clostridia bacterium]